MIPPWLAMRSYVLMIRMISSSSSSTSSSPSLSARFTAAAHSAWTRVWGGPTRVAPKDPASSPADDSLRAGEAAALDAQVNGGLPPALGQAVALTLRVEPLQAAPPLTPTDITGNLFANRPAWTAAAHNGPRSEPGPDPDSEPDHLTVHIRQGRGSPPLPEERASVRFHTPTQAIRERYEAKRQLFEATAARELARQEPFMPITPERTALDAASWGRRLALRDLVSQATGRLIGQAVAGQLLVDTWNSEREAFDEGAQTRVIVGGMCLILTMGVVFGLRAGYLMARAWRGPGDHPGTAALLGMGPTTAQVVMVMMALQYGGIPTGTAVTLNIVNRLVSATVRDVVAQSQAKLWGRLDPVQRDGLDLDPTQSRDAFDRDRLQGARDTYLLTSLALLWIGRWLLESWLDDWITQVPSTTLAGRMRAGLPGIVMSVLNETIDAWQGSQWQNHSAQKNGLALRYTSGYCCGSGRCDCAATGLRDLAERSVSQVGMRQAFGTLTSDIWTTWAEFHPNSGMSEFMLRAVAAMFNSLTTYRGYTVERGRSLSPPELKQAIDSTRHRLDDKIRILETVSIRRAYPEQYEAARAQFSRLFRDFMVEQGIPPHQQAELDKVMRSDRVKKWIGTLAAETVRKNKIAQLNQHRERPFHLETTGDNTFNVVANWSEGSTPIADLPNQTPPPSLPPSAVPSAANTPAVPGRHLLARITESDAGSTAPPSTARRSIILQSMTGATPPGFLQTLRAGMPLFVNDVAVTFLGWRDDGDERKGPPRRLIEVAAQEPLALEGWHEVEAPGHAHIYRLAPSRFRISPRLATPPPDSGEGIGHG